MSILEPDVAEGFGFIEKVGLRTGSRESIDDRVTPNASTFVVVEVEIGVQGWKRRFCVC